MFWENWESIKNVKKKTDNINARGGDEILVKRNKEGHQENPVSSQYIAKNCINIKMHAAQVRQGVTRTQGLLKSGNKMSEIVFKIAQNVYLMTKKKIK